jgi:prepilin-type N-terminal cleavage/methylation domain-containing protein
MLANETRADGFTLVEVLLALLLFALSAVVLGAAYLNVLNSYELVRQNQAVEEDRRFIRSLVLLEPDREELERGGEIESLYLGRVSWRTVLEQTPTPDLFYVTIEVEYEGTGSLDRRQEVQQMILLRPSWSEPTERAQLQADMDQRFQELQQFREFR